MDAEEYQAILQSHRTLFPRATSKRATLQQDGAPAHTARSSKEWLQKHTIQTLDRPAQHSSKDELFNAIAKAFAEVSNEEIARLYESMPHRLDAVIKASGWSTRY